MRRHIRSLAARTRLDVTLAYTTVMAPYAPADVPLLLDMSDVDSEKWLQYARIRRPRLLYSTEGRRFRRLESEWTRRARSTVVMTVQEARLLSSFVPGARIRAIENGVDLERFNPATTAPLSHLTTRRILVLIGFMNYFPNSEAALWFVSNVWPGVRQRDPDLELFIVGRNPTRAVRALDRVNGVSIVDDPGDVRFYLATAVAAIAPLHLARGIQNKVLEALAMGKPVFASREICATLGELPPGVIHCDSPKDYIEAITAGRLDSAQWNAAIRDGAIQRFAWRRCLDGMLQEVEAVVQEQRDCATHMIETPLGVPA
jgi:sugar transferase (PEP-CTERM/EpsH1 system associated)